MREFVALLREQPQIPLLLNSLRGAGLSTSGQTGTTHLYDTTNRLLVTIAKPLRIDVPGEVERLLGTTVPLPIWWVELRAAAGLLPAAPLAHQCAEELVSHHGGLVWTNTRTS
ncbi:hypothetical protein [Actinomadura sp. 9N407]|uniref:hypothetical protein n=1 Tax=Actinomadura sp. 9N407 TaxID=3375154 RepID=UPI0037A48636